MNSLGWHDVFHSTSLRGTYGVRNANITYSGMETKIVYAVGCASMVFVGIYAIIICVVNSLGTHRRNSSVAPMNDGRHDISPGRLDKDLSNIWPAFVVTEMNAGDTGGSRCDTLSKEHPKTHKDCLNDDRNDDTAKKQRLDRAFRNFPKAEPSQGGSDQAKESFRTSTVSEDVQGSSFVECRETSPSTRSLHGASSKERLMASVQTSTAKSLKAATSLQTTTSLQAYTAREEAYTARGLKTYAAGEGLQISTAGESIQPSAAEEGLQTITAVDGFQITAAGEGLQTLTAPSLQTSTSIDGLQITTAEECFQTSTVTGCLQTPIAIEDFQESTSNGDLHLSTARECFQTSTVIERLCSSTAIEDFQESTSNESLHVYTAEECFQTSTPGECLQTRTAIEDFQEYISIENLLAPPASEASTVMEVLQISPDSGLPLPCGDTADLPISPVAKYPRTSVSNSHLHSLPFTENFYGRDQGASPRVINTFWSENVYKFHRPSRVFTTSNSAPNLRTTQAWNDIEHNIPLFHPKNSVHIV